VILYSENKIKTIEREAEEARLQEEQERLKAEAKAKEENRIYENPEEDAKFPGGDEECYKWLYDHIQYPEAARAQGIQGRVFLKFVVETDGSLTNIEVKRSPDPLLSQEALRVVRNMPKWKPAKNKGIVVRVEYNLPIMFKPD
jgi:protein TonB